MSTAVPQPQPPSQSASPSQRAAGQDGSPDKLRVALGSAVGTTVENYDFLAYGTAAALYFGDVFFPDSSSFVATLASFATLAVGFAMRPLGGIIGGHLGDRIGRKPVLVAALIVMGLATTAIGFLPTYAQVGALAPVLLVLLRLIQGIGFGAEWGGAILMTYEHAPLRRKGLYSAIPQAGVPLGLLLANVAFLIAAQFDSHLAWRIPFILSALLIGVGMIIRLKISESPEFEELQRSGEVAKSPVLEVLRKDGRTVLRVIGLRLAETGGFYVIVTYLLSYLKTEDIVSRSVALTGLIVAALLGTGTTLLFGRLSDHFGRRPVYLVGSTLTLLFGFPLFLLVNTGSSVAVVAAFILGLSLCHDSLAGTQGAWFSELFDARVRTSGASLGYQFSAAISGFIPFIAAALAEAWGWGGVALLFSACGLIGLVTALLTRETHPVRAARRPAPEQHAAVVSG
ncbi:MFS transporter [Streptomyces sp. NPDC059255]|uniref:MFS transporter n=1 Tax=Streptomyces sp. NPDC059255 TaxID=3346793 RepID=UPI0036A474FA